MNTHRVGGTSVSAEINKESVDSLYSSVNPESGHQSCDKSGEVESARRQAVGMRDGLKALGKEVSESESREEDDTRLEALRDTRRGLEKATGLAEETMGQVREVLGLL